MIKARKSYGDRVILDDVTLSFLPGAKIGVVGPNGMGKSTLLKIMAGIENVSNGEAYLTPGFTVGILQQEPPLDDTKTVGENIKMAFGEIAEKVARFNQIGEEMANPDADFDALMEEMGALQTEIDAANGWDLDSQLEQAMDALQCPDPDTPVSVCSGGERRRVALCKLLLEAPDLLLLDEPTNHLDAESILWLEQFLHQYQGAVIAVTHDRYFMDNVAEWICEVDRGHLYPYKGNYTTYLETKAKRMEIQGAKDAKLAKRLKSELEWVRSSPKARQAKNKARLERYDQMEQEARNSKKLDFSEIQIPPGPRLGSQVLEAKHIHKAFGDRVLIDDLSFTLPRNGIVGVIGPNGVGKSTLFKTIVGLEPLTSGELTVGETVKISYVDQNRAGLDPKKNLWEAVSGGLDFIEVGGVEVPTRAYVASFGFKGSDQQKLTGVLSGGERNRLNLALTLKQGGNLLLLDEPTNDLDVETLESLENALIEFPGCAVVISHDRWFLDRIATHILAWEGDDENPARWYWFEGNFHAYQENKVARLGEDAARPHRLHRKLTRRRQTPIRMKRRRTVSSRTRSAAFRHMPATTRTWERSTSHGKGTVHDSSPYEPPTCVVVRRYHQRLDCIIVLDSQCKQSEGTIDDRRNHRHGASPQGAGTGGPVRGSRPHLHPGRGAVLPHRPRLRRPGHRAIRGRGLEDRLPHPPAAFHPRLFHQGRRHPSGSAVRRGIAARRPFVLGTPGQCNAVRRRDPHRHRQLPGARPAWRGVLRSDAGGRARPGDADQRARADAAVRRPVAVRAVLRGEVAVRHSPCDPHCDAGCG